MKEKYEVLNYSSFIEIHSEDEKRPIYLEAGELTQLKPFKKLLTLEQIKYANYRSEVFKKGRLLFNEEDREELYAELDIDERMQEKIFTGEEIMDTVKNPTKEKLEKVLAIDNLEIIDFFVGVVVSLKNTEFFDVPTRVSKLIMQRRSEIYRNPLEPTKIVIKKTRNEIESEAKEKAMEEAMLSTIEKMKAEMEAEYAKKLKAGIAKAKRDAKKAVEEK